MARFPLCSFLLSAFALAGTLGQESDLTTTTVDKLSIAQLIDDTVASAKNGVDDITLRNSLESIQQLSDSYLNERGALVDGQDIIDVLGDITDQNEWQFTLSVLLEDPLVQEERKVTAGLFVLNALSLRIRDEDNDTEVNILVAAVRFTAKSVGTSVTIGDTLYNYKEDIGKQVKRWTYYNDYEYPGRYKYKYRPNVHGAHLSRKRWSASGSASGGSGKSSSSSSSKSGRGVRSGSEIQDEQQMDNRDLSRKRWSVSGSASGGSGDSSSSSSSSSGRDARSGSESLKRWGSYGCYYCIGRPVSRRHVWY